MEQVGSEMPPCIVKLLVQADQPSNVREGGRSTAFFNPILFILSIALASGAFKHYHSTDEIFAIETLECDDYWILEWTDDKQDVPFFSSYVVQRPYQTDPKV